MKAVVYRPGARPTLTDVDLAAPGVGEVEVEVAAAGVCHSDLHVTTGAWSVPTPVVLGHEGSGVVARIGDGVDQLKVGDHVVFSWVPSCGQCRNCLGGRPARCSLVADVVAPGGVLYDGTSRLSSNGEVLHHYLGVSSFAERVVVPVSGAVKIRPDAPLDVVALVGCAVATGVGAVQNTAQIEPGATVAVIGCGGVGLSCIQGARLNQAGRVIAIDVVPSKLGLALQLGATDIVNSSATTVDEAFESLNIAGVDYFFDAIGAVSTTETAVANLGLGGAAVVVGLPPAGSRARFDPLALAEREQRILGCNYGSVTPSRDIPRLVDLYVDGLLELDALVSARRPLSEAADALDDLGTGVPLRQLLIPSL